MLRYRSSTITVSSLPLRLAQVFQPANAPLSSMAETAVAGQPYRGSRERRQRSSATPRAASAGHALSGQDLHRPVGRRRRPYDRRSIRSKFERAPLPYRTTRRCRNPCRVSFLVEGSGAFELLAGPELDRGQTQGQALRRDQARMHQKSADSVHPDTAILAPAAVDAIGEPDPRRPLPLVGKLGGVLEHRIGPSVAAKRSPVASKWPARISASLIR